MARILLITNRYPPDIDGIGDYTYRLSHALVELGHSVHILCRTSQAEEENPNILVHPMQQNWRTILQKQLLPLLEEIQPDWTGLQYMPFAFDNIGYPTFLPKALEDAKKSGSRVWITFHEIQIRPKGLKAGFLGRAQGRLARQLCTVADEVLTSIEFYKKLLDRSAQLVRTVPIGSNVAPEPLTEQARSQMKRAIFPDREFVVSTFGNRDHLPLVNAIRNLNEKGKKVGLLICGHTALHPGFSQDRIVFHTGYLPSKQVSTYLQLSDLFILPDYRSKHGEGGTSLKSGSLAAGFALGLPVVGIEGDMNGSLFKHGDNIWLAKNGESDTLEQTILSLMENPQQLQNLKAGSSKLHEQHLAWRQIAQQHQHFLS